MLRSKLEFLAPRHAVNRHQRGQMKRAITGITGEGGSSMAELLLSMGYEIHRIVRRPSTFNSQRIDHVYQDPNQPSAQLLLRHGDASRSFACFGWQSKTPLQASGL